MSCLSLVRVCLFEAEIRNPTELCRIHHTSNKYTTHQATKIRVSLNCKPTCVCRLSTPQKKNVCKVCVYADAPCASKSPKKYLRTAPKVVSCTPTPHMNKKSKSLFKH